MCLLYGVACSSLQMPVVTRADVEEHYMFLKDPEGGFSGSIDKMTVKFGS